VTETAGSGPPSRSPAALLGRGRELAELESALAELSSGRGRCILIAGEPGIGKTRLSDAAAAMAEARGLEVHWGRCWEAGGAPAYFPWLGILGGLAAGLSDEVLVRVLGDSAEVLGRLIPELSHRLPRNDERADPPSGEGRFFLWRGIAALAREASRSHPNGIVLIIDDLHAADRSSLSLLLYLARELRSLRMLVLATYRDVEARVDPEASALIERIAREAKRLALRRLGAEDAAHFVRQYTGEPDERAGARILQVAQGNPLFLAEMARLYAEQGPRAVEDGAIPEGLRAVMGQRLGRVSPETREILEVAAVAGDDIEPGLLARATGRDLPAVIAALREATQAGVLDSGAPGKRFAHALFREVLYRELDEAARADWHGRVADALSASVAPGAPLPDAELAHHLLAASSDHVVRGVAHAIAAAERATALLAYDDAVETLEHALDAVSRTAPRSALRARVLIALGGARIRRGDDGAGKRDCHEAFASAVELEEPELAAQAALVYGRVFLFGAVDPVLVGMLEESLAALPPGDSALRARVLGRLAGALQPSRRMEEPVAVAREALATARRLGDPRTLLDVLHDAISAMMDIVDARELRDINLEAERLALGLGDRERLLRTHARLAFAHLALGELALADTRIAAFENLAKELSAPWLGYRGALLRSVRAQMHGRFDEAERYANEALVRGSGAGDPIARTLYTSNREALLRGAERHDELAAWQSELRRTRDGYRFSATWHAIGVAVLQVRREDAEGARMFLSAIPEDMPNNLFMTFFFGEVIAFVGSAEQAELLLERLVAFPDDYVTLGMSYFSWEGPRSRVLALLLERLERYDEARAAFEDGLARCAALDVGPYWARTSYEYGRMLAARGDGRARELLSAAHERALSLDMPGLVTLAERRLATLDAERGPSESLAPPAARSSAPAGLELELTLSGEYYTLRSGAESLQLKATLGLRYLSQLIAAAGQELHVLDLVGERSGAELVDVGSAGELLDERARRSYEARLEHLRDALAEAEAFDDRERARRLREELEFLGGELARAVGLGGRERKAGAAAERARSAVQRRIRHALERIAVRSPAIAQRLEQSVRTGTYCSFSLVPRRG